MDMQETINYNLYTKLPTRVLSKAEQLNPVIEVYTPHNGVVFIELKKVDKGIFRQASEVGKSTDDVISELVKIEQEAKDYLLNNWVATNLKK